MILKPNSEYVSHQAYLVRRFTLGVTFVKKKFRSCSLKIEKKWKLGSFQFSKPITSRLLSWLHSLERLRTSSLVNLSHLRLFFAQLRFGGGGRAYSRLDYLSKEMATRVKILMLTLRICTVGQNWHIKAGRSHRWSSAAWNWKGIAKIAMVTSAKARLAMYMFVTVLIRL